MSVWDWLIVAAAAEAARDRKLTERLRFLAWHVADLGLRRVGSFLTVRVLAS